MLPLTLPKNRLSPPQSSGRSHFYTRAGLYAKIVVAYMRQEQYTAREIWLNMTGKSPHVIGWLRVERKIQRMLFDRIIEIRNEGKGP